MRRSAVPRLLQSTKSAGVGATTAARSIAADANRTRPRIFASATSICALDGAASFFESAPVAWPPAVVRPTTAPAAAPRHPSRSSLIHVATVVDQPGAARLLLKLAIKLLADGECACAGAGAEDGNHHSTRSLSPLPQPAPGLLSQGIRASKAAARSALKDLSRREQNPRSTPAEAQHEER